MAPRSRFVAPRFLDSFPAVQRALTEVQESLDTSTRSGYKLGLQIKDFSLAAGQFVRVSPPASGIHAVLPAPGAPNAADVITISLENVSGPLVVHAPPRSTVNGSSRATFTTDGIVQLFSNGVDAWTSTAELPAESPAAPVLDAEYVLGASHASLPNGRVATDSPEIDANLVTPGLVSWVLNTASVAFSKLANLTGLSVLGRAANSAGVMAAITATAPRQALMSDAAGTAIAWRAVTVTDIPTIIATTGAVTIPAGGGASLFGPAAAGAGLTGDGTATLAVGAGTHIAVNANDVAVNLATLVPAVDSTSVVANGTVLERAAITGAVSIAQNANTSVFSGILDNGAATTDQPNLNLIGFTVANNPGASAIDITAPSVGSLPLTITTESAAGPFNDYAIPDLSANDFILVAATTGQIFTGFAASGGNVDGYKFRILVGASGGMTLDHLGSGSVSANRVACQGSKDKVYPARDFIELEYVQSTWRVVGDRFPDADSEVTIATTGNLDLTFSDVPATATRLTLTGAAPVLRSIEGGTQTGRELLVYYNGSGTCIVLHSSATGASGNESRLFNPDNEAFYLHPRQSFNAQANGALGWRTLPNAMNRTHTVGDGVNTPNSINLMDANDDIVLAAAGTNSGVKIQTGLGAGGYFDVTCRDILLSAAGGDIACDASGLFSIDADNLRLTTGSGTLGGFLVIQESIIASPSLSAGDGMLWVEGTAPNRLMFTDDANQDQPVGFAAQGALDNRTTTTPIPAVGSAVVLATATYVASELRAGATFRFFGQVTWVRGATNTATNVTLEFRVGGTQRFAIAAAVLQTAASTHQSWIEGYFTVQAAPGAAANCAVSGWFAHDIVTAGTIVENIMTAAPNNFTAATNGALTLDIRAFASVGAILNTSLTPIHGHIQRIN